MGKDLRAVIKWSDALVEDADEVVKLLVFPSRVFFAHKQTLLPAPPGTGWWGKRG